MLIRKEDLQNDLINSLESELELYKGELLVRDASLEAFITFLNSEVVRVEGIEATNKEEEEARNFEVSRILNTINALKNVKQSWRKI